MLQGHCFEFDRVLPFALLLDLLRDALSTQPAEALAAVLRPVSATLIRLFPEFAEILPDVVPGLPLDPEQEKRRLFQSLIPASYACSGAPTASLSSSKTCIGVTT